MGLDLTLCIPGTPSIQEEMQIQIYLPLSRDSLLFDAIGKVEALSGSTIPALYGHYGTNKEGESEYGLMNTNDDGLRTKYVSVSDLLGCFEEATVVDTEHFNYATWQYLRHIPLGWPIFLYWF